MSVLAPPPPEGVAPAERLYRISVAQYHEMMAKGIIRSGEPVELIEGTLVKKMTINPPHDFAAQALQEGLTALVPAGWFVSGGSPLTTDDSEPERDVSVIRGRRRDFAAAGRHAGPGDLGLVAEVSDSSPSTDRGTKRRVYARGGVGQYWVVNVVDRRVQVYTDPTGPCDEPAYRRQQDHPAGGEVPVVLDGREVGRVRVDDLLL